MALQREALARAAGRTALDALDASDAEDEMLDRLEDDGRRRAVAAGRAAGGRRRRRGMARRGRATWPGRRREAALRWVAASLTARGLACELLDSAERMSGLVGAVKSYAYMDRGGLVEVDVHEGLETTLTVLGHKLKHTRRSRSSATTTARCRA